MTDLDKWFMYLKSEDKSNNTIESYKSDVIQFMNFIEKELEEVTKEDIMRYKNYLKDNDITINSSNRKYIAINQYLSFLQTELNYNVIVRIPKDKVQSQEYLEEMLKISIEHHNKMVNKHKLGNWKLIKI